MIRNFQLKMEEIHMESLYCLMNINSVRKYVKDKKKNNFMLPSSPFPKYPKSRMTLFENC